HGGSNNTSRIGEHDRGPDREHEDDKGAVQDLELVTLPRSERRVLGDEPAERLDHVAGHPRTVSVRAGAHVEPYDRQRVAGQVAPAGWTCSRDLALLRVGLEDVGEQPLDVVPPAALERGIDDLQPVTLDPHDPAPVKAWDSPSQITSNWQRAPSIVCDVARSRSG